MSHTDICQFGAGCQMEAKLKAVDWDLVSPLWRFLTGSLVFPKESDFLEWLFQEVESRCFQL